MEVKQGISPTSKATKIQSMNFDNYSIRPLENGDAEDFHQLISVNRSGLEDFFPVTVAATQTKDDTKAYVQAIIRKSVQKTYLPYVIIDISTNTLIGFIDVKNIDWKIPKGELGYFMDKQYSGKGIFTKALKTFTDFCFTDLGFNKLLIRTHQNNLPACGVAEQCGFEQEGVIRCDHKTTSGQLLDLVYYGKTRAV